MIPFSLLWGGLGILVFLAAAGDDAGCVLLFWTVPFVLVGLYMMGGRFLVDSWQRARTYYGVTNERVLISSGLHTRSVRSLNLATLGDISLSEKPDGRGTIAFGPAHPLAASQANLPWPGASRYAAPMFEMIQDARTVHDLIRKTQKERQS